MAQVSLAIQGIRVLAAILELMAHPALVGILVFQVTQAPAAILALGFQAIQV